ncbi:MAG TPA: hypothetical protein VD710_07130 [Nitrososphaeraceae archaeon]|nr:hypothetical protein [Nitrososphaeraceae archaeon]
MSEVNANPEDYDQPVGKGISDVLFPKLKEKDDGSIQFIEDQLVGKK